jgi:hypothetical protein
LGNITRQADAAAPLPLARSRWLERGFSNVQLLISLAVLAVVSLLMQVQAGEVDLGSMLAASAKPSKSTKRSSKAPDLIPPEVKPSIEVAADQYVMSRTDQVRRLNRMQRETLESFARMDGEAAALILAELELDTAVEILAFQKERDLARILEYADPADAASYITDLLKRRQLTEIPDEFKPATAEAGLYDNTGDLLEQYRQELAAMEQEGAADGQGGEGAQGADTADNTENTGTTENSGQTPDEGAETAPAGGEDPAAAPDTGEETQPEGGEPPPEVPGEATARLPGPNELG